MVEELKLAIKVDDDAIEQALLKQFANAEKMANKVVLTFNNIDLDNKAIEAKFKEMQKIAGKNPIDLSIDKSSIEMLSAISKQLGNIFDIAKGKSIIDSSATVADVNKITQSTNQQVKAVEKVTSSYKNQAYELASILKMLAKLDKYGDAPYAENLSKVVKSSASTFKEGNSIQFAALKNGFTEEMLKYLRGFSVNLSGAFNYSETLGLDNATISNVEVLINYFRELLKEKLEFNNIKLNTSDIEELIKALGILKKEHFDDGTKSGRNIYGDGSLDKYSDLPTIIQYLKQQEKQAIATAQAVQKLTDVEKEVGSSSVSESQNKIQEELKETQKQAEQTSEALSKIGDVDKSNISSGNELEIIDSEELIILDDVIEKEEKVIETTKEMYRAFNSSHGVSGKNGISWFASDLADAVSYLDIGNTNKNSIAKLITDTSKFLTVDAKGAQWGEILYDGIEHTTDEIAEMAKQAGYVGVEFKNIQDSFNGISDNENSVFAIFDDNLLKNITDYTEATRKKVSEINEITSYVDGKLYENFNGSSVSIYDNVRNQFDSVIDLVKDGTFDIETAFTEVDNIVERFKKNPIKDVFQGDKIDQATTSAKELDKTLEQVNIPTDSFDEVLSKLDLTKSELKEIVKITKQSVSDSDGKFRDSYTIKDSRGSTEIYGLSSNTEKGQLLRSNIVGYDAKEIEKANKQILKSEQELQAQKDAFHKKNLTAIDLEIQKREEESKMVSSALKTQMEERQKQLSSMESSLKSYQDKVFNLSIKPDDAHRFPEYQAQLDNINKAIQEYKTFVESLQGKGIIDESDISESEKLKTNIEKLLKETKTFSSGDKGFTNIGADKVLEKINSILEQNSRMSKTAKDQIKAYYNEIYSGNPTRPLNEILDSVYKIVQQEREAGRAGKSWLEIFKDKKIYSFLGQAASMFSFYDLINLGRQSFETIRGIDTALVDLKKTTAMNSNQLEEFYYDSNDVAKQMGVTTQAIIEQASAWSRLGYNTKESSTQMAELSSQFAAISPDMDLDTATDGLVSSMKAFDIEVSNVERDIMDNINRIGNTAATSNGEIVDMLTRSSAAMAAANNTIQETIALETAAVEITRNAETTGTAFKTLSMRIRGRQTLPPYTVMYMLCA